MTRPQDGEESGLPAPDAAAPAEQPQAAAQQAGQYWQAAPPPPQLYPMSPVGQPQFYPPQGYPPMRPGTNSFAIVAFVTSLVLFFLGPIFGFIALNQIKRTGEQGRGFAIAGIWIGFASAVFFILWTIFIVSTFHQFEQQIPMNP